MIIIMIIMMIIIMMIMLTLSWCSRDEGQQRGVETQSDGGLYARGSRTAMMTIIMIIFVMIMMRLMMIIMIVIQQKHKAPKGLTLRDLTLQWWLSLQWWWWWWWWEWWWQRWCWFCEMIATRMRVMGSRQKASEGFTLRDLKLEKETWRWWKGYCSKIGLEVLHFNKSWMESFTSGIYHLCH